MANLTKQNKTKIRKQIKKEVKKDVKVALKRRRNLRVIRRARPQPKRMSRNQKRRFRRRPKQYSGGYVPPANSYGDQVQAQDCFVYGLLDPQRASRGPVSTIMGEAQRPTIVIPFTSTTTFKTLPNPYSGAATETVNGTGWKTICDPTAADAVGIPGGNINLEYPYMHANNGSIAVVCTPHFVTSNYQDGVTSSYYINQVPGANVSNPNASSATDLLQMCAGFTCDPTTDDGSAGVYETSAALCKDTCKPFPLANYNRTLPTYKDEFGATCLVPFRVVGHKAKITIETNEYDCEGDIFALDNRAITISSRHLYTKRGGHSFPFSTESETAVLTDRPLDKAKTAAGVNVTPLGMIKSGDAFECAWIPQGANSLQWNQCSYGNTGYTQTVLTAGHKTQFRGVKAFPGGYPGYDGAEDSTTYATRADVLQNNASVIFLLSGFKADKGIALKVEVVTALEFQHIPESSNSLMDYEFAYAKNFLPEFSEVLALTNAAKVAASGSMLPGVVAAGIQRSPMVARGAKCRLGAIKERPLIKPPSSAMGGVSITGAVPAAFIGRRR